MMISISNNGQELVSTNYFDSTHAHAGYLYLSINAGAVRLLVPDVMVPAIPEMATGKYVVISRGPWPSQGRPDAMEIMFEDRSKNPYAIHMLPEQCDMLPDQSWIGKRRLFSAWSRAGKKLERPCYYRKVDALPCLRKYKRPA